MASLTMGFKGSVVGGMLGGPIGAQIGGFIGSSLGSLIDNQLFPNRQEGPRLTDLTVQTSTYGKPIPLVFGPENRIAGNVIWSSGLIETAHHRNSKKGKGGPSVEMTTFTYAASFAVLLCDCSKRGPIRRVLKIWANRKLIYDVLGGSAPDSAGLWDSLAVYLGDFAQMPDPTMEAHLGAGEVPAYRGRAYMVFSNFQLADYGNRLPSLEFLVEADEEIAAAAVVHYIAGQCGIDKNTVSAIQVSGNVRGYVIGSNSSGTAALQPMALVYNFDSAQVAGCLRFAPRGAAPFAYIPSAQLSGHAAGDERPSPLNWTRTLEASLPREASITFPDPDRDYQINSQVARRQAGSSENNLTTELPIVLDVDAARQIADRLLWEATTGRGSCKVQTDDRWISLEAGRVYVMETPAGIEPLRLKNRTRGANGVIELEMARDRAEVYRSTATGVAVPTLPQVVNVPGPSTLAMLDCPILQDADDDTGFYFVVDGLMTGWRGADVIRSKDAGATYEEVTPVGFQSIVGTIDALPSGGTADFDHETVVRVTLADPSDELESVTELDVCNGRNACWIGPASGEDGEVLQFTTADLVSPGVYDISGLLRGRVGTEYAVGGHSPGEIFVLLVLGKVQRADFSTSDWNRERIYKAVSLLTMEADATPIPFTNTGEGKRPLSPVHVESITDPGTGDTTIMWSRRSRYRQPGLGYGPLPLGENTEAYEIDVYLSSTFKRTLTASSESVVYNSAMKSADGTAGSTVTVKVYQMSDMRGRGRPGTGILLI